MIEGALAQIRSFNRLVVQRVGALDDRYLTRNRPLGEARVLWEIGADGCDVRALRSRLGLDSGYLSRLLRPLEARFRTGFDPALSIPAELDELRPPAGMFLLATLRGEPVGCGALKLHGEQPAELKRMWVAASARGLGLGRRLLCELERHAAAA